MIHMQVQEIMTRNIIAINSDESVLDACKKYSTYKVGSLVVMDNDIIVGIVTERDIIESMVLVSGDPKNTKVRDIMTSKIKTIHAMDSLEKAAEVMKEYNIKKSMGYLIDDYVGRSGIEYLFEEVLRGVHGGRQIEVNARGREVREIAHKKPFPGSDLSLTLDIELQSRIQGFVGKIRSYPLPTLLLYPRLDGFSNKLNMRCLTKLSHSACMRLDSYPPNPNPMIMIPKKL